VEYNTGSNLYGIVFSDGSIAFLVREQVIFFNKIIYLQQSSSFVNFRVVYNAIIEAVSVSLNPKTSMAAIGCKSEVQVFEVSKDLKFTLRTVLSLKQTRGFTDQGKCCDMLLIL
jgi:hypothetical protein